MGQRRVNEATANCLARLPPGAQPMDQALLSSTLRYRVRRRLCPRPSPVAESRSVQTLWATGGASSGSAVMDETQLVPGLKPAG